MNNELDFSINSSNHVLIPNNKESKMAQELAFNMLEKYQLEYIQAYNVMTKKYRIRKSHQICYYFVRFFMNGDGASFRLLVGYEHKGLMTQEELKNIIRDFKIAQQKKKNGEFKTFLLLDLCVYSNRRADSIIITNDYKIELYDFSEGVIAEKIKVESEENLNQKEIEQKRRKEKQQKRIDSFKNNIKSDSSPISNVVVDNKELDIRFINIEPSFYPFEEMYKYFIEHNYERTYIPNSLCFLYKKEEASNHFLNYSLMYNIDSPFFLTEKKSMLDQEIIEDVYRNNTYIGLSIPYAVFFIDNFTYFKIHAEKRQDKLLGNNQLSLIIKNKKRYIYLEDVRTKKWVALSRGIIEKHLFMNLSLKTMMIYIDCICNPNANDNFTYNIIKYKELKDSEMNFFVIDID